MKKITLAILMGLFGVSAVHADGFSRAIPSSNSGAATSASSGATTSASRTTASRVGTRTGVVDKAPLSDDADDNVSTISRGASRTGVVDNARATSTSRAVSRVGVSQDSARSNLDAAVNTVGRNARVSAASINNTAAVRRAGVSLRPSTAEVGGRATFAGTDIQTGSNMESGARGVQSRAATKATAESIAEAKDRLEQTADLNKSCQQQYNECMDQFCNVINSNQGRCSCSVNLAQYAKVESAVKDANTQLNEVAQRIRYVGLSADEIRAIMTATEAEEELSGKKDTTETRSMLEDIADLIKDPTGNSSYYSDNSFGLDLDLDFSSQTSDLFNLDFLNTGTTGSFSNLRGRDLYNAAKKRCNTILTQCKQVGATSQQITGNYDLAIDKDCIAYEQGLTKMNETLASNVRSANLMLQKARLAVLQNKNQYDAKGCISALETCMTDDMVCGSDYAKCLDPTKKYIDENGNVVLGQNITHILDFMKEYNSAAIDKDFLGVANSNATIISTDYCKASVVKDGQDKVTKHGDDGICVVKYLMTKIGTGQKTTDNGLCRAVLDKCQRYTYADNNKYQPYNDVVVNYVQRAMVNIKAAQQKIISDYASSCMLDVATCYNQQVTQVNAWSSAASAENIRSVMRGACRNVAVTCGFAIFDGVPEYTYTSEGGLKVAEACGYANACGTDTSAGGYEACVNSAYIDCVSDIFYQSLLCPDNSTYDTGFDAIDNNDGMSAGANGGAWVNSVCKCKEGYDVWAGACAVKCPENASRNTYGTCVCNTGYTMKNNMCESNNPEEGD